MRTSATLLVLVVVLLCILSALPASAWGGATHKKITSDAYFIMPQAFRQFLGETLSPKRTEPNLTALLDASVEPDTVLKDFKNHIYHIQGYDLGNGPFNVASLSQQITEDIKNKAPLPKIIQKLGWIAHYTGDLVQPLHTGVSLDENIEEKAYHSGFENDATKNLYSYSVWFDGAKVHTRMSAFIIYEALWANQYYSTIETAYTKGNRYPDAERVAITCYSKAVNNVVDVWYTIWANAGGKIDPVNDAKPKFFPAYLVKGQNKIVARGLATLIPRGLRHSSANTLSHDTETSSQALPRITVDDSPASGTSSSSTEGR